MGEEKEERASWARCEGKRKKGNFPFMNYDSRDFGRDSKGIQDEFKRGSRGTRYGFVHSKLKPGTNSRTKAHSYNQFYMMHQFISKLSLV